jgi:hypothetical protein
MPLRWAVIVCCCLASAAAPRGAPAQSPTTLHLVRGVVPAPVAKFRHNKKLLAVYDSVADSTQLSVRTHKGKYFLTIQRPRLTWSVAYPGRQPDGTAPEEVSLEFRTQSPQVALDSRLQVLYGTGEHFDVPSAGAHSDPGVVTWSHFMRFPVPAAALAEALRSQKVLVTVGGVSEYLQPDHLEALRDLLSRVGAYADGPAGGGGM